MKSRSRRKKLRTRTSVHHRKCVSNGGTDDPSNLIEVPFLRHRWWHAMFDNMDAYGIGHDLQAFWMPSERIVVLKTLDEGVVETKRILRVDLTTTPSPNKKYAWRKFSKRRSHDMILEEINRVWIDPVFEIRRLE